ncbi:MAG: hypothetical protein ACP5N7_00900 [Candidatus Pacearchaeota archaeon]
MSYETSNLLAIKIVLALIVLCVIAVTGKTLYQQAETIENYKKQEYEFIESRVNYQLSEQKAVISATEPLKSKISVLELENAKLVEKLKYITSAYVECKQDLEYVELPDKELVEKDSIDVIYYQFKSDALLKTPSLDAFMGR